MSLLPPPEVYRAGFRGMHDRHLPPRVHFQPKCDKALCGLDATEDLELAPHMHAWLCQTHYLMAFWAMACELGVTDPWRVMIDIAREERLPEIERMRFLDAPPRREFIAPEQFVCRICGGKMQKGPGILGPVYSHNCRDRS